MSLFFTQYNCLACKHAWLGQSGVIGNTLMGEHFKNCPECKSSLIDWKPYTFHPVEQELLSQSMQCSSVGAKPYVDALRQGVKNKVQQQVEEFHKACDVPVGTKPQLIPFKRQLLREADTGRVRRVVDSNDER